MSFNLSMQFFVIRALLQLTVNMIRSIPDNCYGHHGRCPCTNILSGVKFSRLNTKTAYIWLFRDIFECVGVFLVYFRVWASIAKAVPCHSLLNCQKCNQCRKAGFHNVIHFMLSDRLLLNIFKYSSKHGIIGHKEKIKKQLDLDSQFHILAKIKIANSPSFAGNRASIKSFPCK